MPYFMLCFHLPYQRNFWSLFFCVCLFFFIVQQHSQNIFRLCNDEPHFLYSVWGITWRRRNSMRTMKPDEKWMQEEKQMRDVVKALNSQTLYKDTHKLTCVNELNWNNFFTSKHSSVRRLHYTVQFGSRVFIRLLLATSTGIHYAFWCIFFSSHLTSDSAGFFYLSSTQVVSFMFYCVDFLLVFFSVFHLCEIGICLMRWLPKPIHMCMWAVTS